MKPLRLREFLQQAPRWVFLAGFAAFAAFEHRKRTRLEGDPNCIRLWTCADCVEFGGCSKPKAETFRKEHPVENEPRRG